MHKINVLNLISTIRESFGSSIATYTQGNCYQFYEILKVIFPNAEAYESGHIYTKINGKFYDIRGELNQNLKLNLVKDEHIPSLTQNKWSDERRKEYGRGN